MNEPGLPQGQKPSLCFVALQAYGVLTGDERAGHIGGAEVQQCLIARGLARRGYTVSMVTQDEGQPDGRVHGGVRALRSYRPQAGLHGLRFFWPRITRTWAAMRRADASIYYQRTSDSVTGVVAAFCRRHRRRFVFSVGANEDCITSLPNCSTRRERLLYIYGLRHADVVVAQTPWQRDALARNLGRSSLLIRSTAPDPGEPSPPPADASPRFLWAGRLAPRKRPELFLEIARLCPGADFDLVGSTPEEEQLQTVKKATAGIPNIRLHGFVPHGELGAFYSRARALVCTSLNEGFPNTFLEAWSRGRPVVTTTDPGDVVRSERIGLVANDVEALVAAVRLVAERKDEWVEMAARARAYYLREHHPERILDEYEALLRTLSST